MGNDYTLSKPHVESVNIVVRHMLEKDPVFVQNNTALVTEFLKASCMNNCSNNGICNDQGMRLKHLDVNVCHMIWYVKIDAIFQQSYTKNVQVL